MPDDDVIYISLTRGWRRAGRMLHSDASPEMVADAVTTAVCRSLRELGGCPGLHEMLDLFEAALHTERGVSWADGSRQLVRKVSGHIHTRRLRDLCTGLLASQTEAMRGLETASLRHWVASQLVFDLTTYHLFSRLRPALWKERGDLDLARAREEECRQGLPTDAIAARLLHHPTGAGLVAPARRRAPMRTEEMLHAWP